MTGEVIEFIKDNWDNYSHLFKKMNKKDSGKKELFDDIMDLVGNYFNGNPDPIDHIADILDRYGYEEEMIKEGDTDFVEYFIEFCFDELYDNDRNIANLSFDEQTHKILALIIQRGDELLEKYLSRQRRF